MLASVSALSESRGEVQCTQTLQGRGETLCTSTYTEWVDDDFIDSIWVSSHSCGNLPPVPQPHTLTRVDQGGVIVELVVQHHVEAVACKQADDKHVAVKGRGKAI